MRVSIASLGKDSGPQFLERVRLAELLGFDGYFHNDAKWRRDVYSRLGAAATVTSRINLGIAVTDPFTRHPAITAQAVASLEELAPGRVTVTLGSGSHFETLPGFGIGSPLSAIRESIGLMRSLWRGEEVSVDGEVVHFDAGRFEFTPPSSPTLWVAARGSKTLQLAGELADGALIGSFASPAGIRYAMTQIGRGAALVQRPVGGLQIASWLYVSVLEREDDEVPITLRRGISYAFWSSRDVLTNMLEELAPDASPEFRHFLASAPRSWDPELLAEMEGLMPRQLLDSMAVVGTTRQVTDRLLAIEEAGVGRAVCWLFPRPGQSENELVAELAVGVLPAVQR